MAITTQQSNKKPATKDDLVKLEKKLEKKLASKKDLEKFATKKEIKKDFEKFAIRAFDTFSTKEDIKELRQEMATKEDINKILTAVDGITKQYQEFNIGFVMNQGAHDRFEEKIIKTEKRVEVIEKKLK
ncbi:hypothetical protein KAI65_03310 [Candidatus Parcubacteria bacterium]|nr:hypothetical protein [Candidatus Parcubacteria bacterium]